MSNGFSATVDGSLLQTFMGFTTAQGGYAAPSSFYVALFKTSGGIGAAKSLTGISEWTTTDSTSYARQALGIGPSNWNASTFSQTTGVTLNNSVAVSFPAYVAGAASTTVYSVGIMDALTGGNLLWFYDLSSGQSISAGIIVQFNIGDITFSLL